MRPVSTIYAIKLKTAMRNYINPPLLCVIIPGNHSVNKYAGNKQSKQRDGMFLFHLSGIEAHAYAHYTFLLCFIACFALAR